MEQPKELPLYEQVKPARKDAIEVAKKLRISRGEALALMSHRELVIINIQLTQLHEMFDLLYGEKVGEGAKKAKGRKR